MGKAKVLGTATGPVRAVVLGKAQEQELAREQAQILARGQGLEVVPAPVRVYVTAVAKEPMTGPGRVREPGKVSATAPVHHKVAAEPGLAPGQATGLALKPAEQADRGWVAGKACVMVAAPESDKAALELGKAAVEPGRVLARTQA